MFIKQNHQSWDQMKYQLFESLTKEFGQESQYWQDFHQASVICSIDHKPRVAFQAGAEYIKKLQESINYDAYPSLKIFSLPLASIIDRSLSQVILERRSCRSLMIQQKLPLQDLSDLLYYGYGPNPNGFKNVPSGGALYPLDLYIYCANVENLQPGLYYYVQREHGIKLLPKEIEEKEIEKLFADPRIYDTIRNASIQIFITASFLKTIWKYSERGYRFGLIEAGHLAQNIDLIAASKKLACLNIGGFYDLEVNEFLGLDGLLDANLYIIGIGYICTG